MRSRGLALVLVLACACGASARGAGRPVASVPTTKEAAIAFAELQGAFLDAERPRAAVRLQLERFIDKYEGDGAVPLARAYLAHVCIDLEDDDAAKSALDALAEQGPGTAKDLATIAAARLERREGKAGAAFERLAPLVGKVIDEWARAIVDRELTAAAVESGRSFESLAYMDTWLREAREDEHEEVRAGVRDLLQRVPRQALEPMLRSARASGGTSGYTGELQRLVAERLAFVALETDDRALAEWLLGEDLLYGDAALALSDMSRSRRGRVFVSGRSVGVVLPASDPELREIAAEVARGVAFALDMPRGSGPGDGTRLLTRTDPKGDVVEALDDLSEQGAAVIIAAADVPTGEKALAWAERKQIPVLVLAAPPNEVPGRYGFVLGERRRTQVAALEAIFGQRRLGVPRLVATPLYARALPKEEPFVPCHEDAAKLAPPGARAFIVAGNDSCARFVAVAASRQGGTVGLTLEATSAFERSLPNVRIFGLGAGRFPARKDDASVAAFVAKLGGAPTWWTVLGRDAGALARAAVQRLPADDAESPAEVARRRDVARAALEVVEIDAWSSDERRLGADHALSRTLRAIELPR
jgi:predicted negative regulator of RcsB-dependent stress response